MLKLGYTETGLEDVAAFQILKILNHLLLVFVVSAFFTIPGVHQILGQGSGKGSLATDCKLNRI